MTALLEYLDLTALLEYLDLTALLEYIDLLNRYSGGPSWGLLEPLSGWGPGQNAPVAPPPPPVGGPGYCMSHNLV